MTTDCPGVIVVSAQQVKIAQKKLDFVGGQWIIAIDNGTKC